MEILKKMRVGVFPNTV